MGPCGRPGGCQKSVKPDLGAKWLPTCPPRAPREPRDPPKDPPDPPNHPPKFQNELQNDPKITIKWYLKKIQSNLNFFHIVHNR